ncbi:MAG: DUF4349 domain-containing protein [Clostridia bacterium]|nr:DUF4349 domain-containing protein [Clostridia bacterium]
MSKVMDCRAFEENLNDLLDGLLEEDVRLSMEEHARNCADCALLLDQTTKMLTMCAELDEDLEIPLPAQAAWRKAVRMEAAKGKPGPNGRNKWKVFGSIAAAFVLLFGATMAYRSQKPAASMLLGSQYRTAATNTASEAVYETDGAWYADERAPVMFADGETEEALGVTADVAAGDTFDTGKTQENRQVILRSASRSLESNTFDQMMESTAGLISDFDGRVENSTVRGRSFEDGGSGRTAEITARIPSASLDEFLSALDALGTVTARRETSEDVTERYVDTQSRLEALRTQLTRLNELTKTAASLDELLLLEDKIAQVQSEIDSNEQMLRYWQSRESESVVSIDLTEIPAYERTQPIEENVGERIRAAFSQSLSWLKEFLQDSLVVLAGFAPHLVILLPAIAILWAAVHLIRRRKRKK